MIREEFYFVFVDAKLSNATFETFPAKITSEEKPANTMNVFSYFIRCIVIRNRLKMPGISRTCKKTLLFLCYLASLREYLSSNGFQLKIYTMYF